MGMELQINAYLLDNQVVGVKIGFHLHESQFDPFLFPLAQISWCMDKLNIAIFGDSLVWGQGLKHREKFAFQAANRIAQVLGKEADVKIFSAHSGTKIYPNPGNARGDSITLPSGKVVEVRRGDHLHFYETYPSLFPKDDEKTMSFFQGRDEEVGYSLNGEINETLPTIIYQVNQVDRFYPQVGVLSTW
jgi:hypothetical protein